VTFQLLRSSPDAITAGRAAMMAISAVSGPGAQDGALAQQMTTASSLKLRLQL